MNYISSGVRNKIFFYKKRGRITSQKVKMKENEIKNS